MKISPLRKLCILTQTSAFGNQVYTIGSGGTYFFMSSYFTNDCPITLTVTANPLINTLSSYFYISSSTTTDAGTYTINVSVTDGINTISDSFILTASYSCATDAIILSPSYITYYEVGDGAVSCYSQSYSINISPDCGPITYGSILENGGALTSKFTLQGILLKVYTVNPADAGIYTITQQSSLPAGATDSSINTVHITYCIVESVVPPTLSNVVFYIETPHTEPYKSWSVTNGIDCGPWAFSATINGSPVSTPFNFLTSTSSGLTKLNSGSTLQAYIGVYTVVITGSVIAGRISNTVTYTYEITSICVPVTFTAPSMPALTIYVTTNPQVAIPFSQFTGTGIDTTCVTYALYNSGTTTVPDNTVFTLDTPNRQILIQTNLDTKAGTYNLVLEGYSAKRGQTLQTSPFTVQIQRQCDSAVITPAIIPASITYYVYTAALQYDFTSTSTFTVAVCGTIVYTIIDLGTSLTPTTAIFTIPTANIFQILTSDAAEDGNSYTIQITSNHNGYTGTGVVSFTVNIVDTCPGAIITPPLDQTLNYELGIPNSVITLSSPSSDITHCNTYQYSLPISNTVMFSFNSATNQLTMISSIDIAQIGTYTMTLTSTLVVNGFAYPQTVTHQITVIIVGGCVTTAITTPTIPLLIYQVNTGTMTYTFPPWTESHGICTPFTFSAFDTITLSLPTFITLTSATRTFSLLSTNDADSAIYDIQINGALTYVSSSMTFQLEVRPTCYVTSITAIPLQPLAYLVGDPMGMVQYLPFVESPCSRGITYTATLEDGSPLPAFVTFDPVMIRFTFQTSDNANAKSFRLQVSASVNNIVRVLTLNEIFELNIIPMTYSISTNNAPTFNSPPLDINMAANDNLNYRFPDITDPDGDSVTISLDSAPTFVIISSASLILSPQVSDIGSYSIQVTLQDNASSPQKTSYTIALVVTDIQEDEGSTESGLSGVESAQEEFAKLLKEQIRGDYVTGKIKEINNVGVVTVLFGDYMVIPEDTAIIDQSVLSLALIKGDESNEGQIEQWQLISYNDNQLQLQLTFNNAKFISQSIEKDKLQLVFLKNYLFIANTLDKTVEPLYTLVKQFPTQVEGDGKLFKQHLKVKFQSLIQCPLLPLLGWQQHSFLLSYFKHFCNQKQ